MAALVLGPMARWASTAEATVWVETDAPCTVEVRPDGAPSAHERTFAVDGHHYAIVRVGALPEDAATPYEVALDDDVVWPPPDSPFPPSALRTHAASCQSTSVARCSASKEPPCHPPSSSSRSTATAGSSSPRRGRRC